VQDLVGRQAEDVLDLGRHPVGLGGREVDLVERGHDAEVVLHGQVAVGQGLGLDALGGVDEEDDPFAGGQRPGHLVAEVDVPGGVDQVDDVALVVEPDVLRLDRDAPLPLDVHRVEVLGPHVPGIDCAAVLQDPVSQGGFAMVDVRDHGDVADGVGAGHRLYANLQPFRYRVLESPCMANIKSQKKRILTNARRQERNKAVRSELKTRVKSADQAATQSAEDVDEQVRRAVKALDMAAAKGIIHKNQAANRKSKLMKRVAKAQASS
jgi:small subunit ribosomal protein S20